MVWYSFTLVRKVGGNGGGGESFDNPYFKSIPTVCKSVSTSTNSWTNTWLSNRVCTLHHWKWKTHYRASFGFSSRTRLYVSPTTVNNFVHRETHPWSCPYKYIHNGMKLVSISVPSINCRTLPLQITQFYANSNLRWTIHKVEDGRRFCGARSGPLVPMIPRGQIRFDGLITNTAKLL